MTNQNVQTNPTGPTPTQVVVAGNPTRGNVTFSVTGHAAPYARASLWAQTATAPFGYTEDIQLAVFDISANGPPSMSREVRFNLAYNMFLFANLDIIGPTQATFASMSLTV